MHPATRLLPALVVASVATLAAVPATEAPAGAAGTLTHTRQVVVRPVTEAGLPAAGYSVTKVSGPLSCDDQSAASVSGHVDTCYPSALYVPSCWRSTRHTALCLRAADFKDLVRIRYAGTFRLHHALRPARRTPQLLRLANGERCTIRVGGAWGDAPGHPSWLGFYSCTYGSLYGTLASSGIDRGHAVWTVHELLADNSLVTRKVSKATYVGTAG